MEFKIIINKSNYIFLRNSIVLFFYIFCFHIIGFFQSSMLAGCFCLFMLWKRKQLKLILLCSSNIWLIRIFSFQITILILTYFYSLYHASYDLDYCKIIAAQIIHFLIGVLVIAYFCNKRIISINEIIALIVSVYLIQSFIELFASAVPQVAAFTSYFSGDSKFQTSSNGTRGLALSGSNGWGLSLSYGFVFLIYVQQYMNRHIGFKCLMGWISLVLGTFFAGRTGLAGALISLLYLLFFSRNSLYNKIFAFFQICLLVILFILLVFIIYPEYIDFATTYLLPYALEPVYNYIDGNGFSSASTDDLQTMWIRPVSFHTLLWGDGYLIGSDGKYYLHTDVGVLRNIFFWGISGYLILIFYQLFMVYPMLKNKRHRVIMILGLIYFVLCECKAMTIGISKMLMTILFLINLVIILNKTNEHKIKIS